MLVFKVHVKKVGIYLGGHTDTPNRMECIRTEGNQCTAGRSLELLLKSKGMIELTKMASSRYYCKTTVDKFYHDVFEAS